MPSQTLSRLAPAVMLLTLSLSAPGHAADPIRVTPLQPERPDPVSDLKPAALDPEELSTISAGADTHIDVITQQDLTAVNSGNSISADSVGSGSINLTSGALQGYNGVGNFVMNTGHNNNLQGTVSVTVINTADLPRQ
ncbi:hypothetical protein [Asticcacaulis tiandongensis]|uniref:hypothetical protein n=1 Tax=Asticcacaulis tiandongensis TaxID=2565365 RepID=UPI001128056F|nr:hypothetical protein [Asticcacaulis tiandongensis]